LAHDFRTVLAVESCFLAPYGVSLTAPAGWDKARQEEKLSQCRFIAPLRVLSLQCEVIMFDIKKDIQAMTTFRRNPGKFMKHLKKTKKPLVLTVNGKAEAVVQDAEAYQRLLDMAAQADALEGIRQGIEDTKKGRVRPAREALEMFRRNHAIPR
jgi:prevent-host-death family protein